MKYLHQLTTGYTVYHVPELVFEEKPRRGKCYLLLPFNISNFDIGNFTLLCEERDIKFFLHLVKNMNATGLNIWEGYHIDKVDNLCVDEFEIIER